MVADKYKIRKAEVAKLVKGLNSVKSEDIESVEKLVVLHELIGRVIGIPELGSLVTAKALARLKSRHADLNLALIYMEAVEVFNDEFAAAEEKPKKSKSKGKGKSSKGKKPKAEESEAEESAAEEEESEAKSKPSSKKSKKSVRVIED